MVDEKPTSFDQMSMPPQAALYRGSSDLKTLSEVSRRPSTETFVARELYPNRDDQNDYVEGGLKKEEHYNLDVTPGEGEISPSVDNPKYVIVGWNGDNDQDNPRNWSLASTVLSPSRSCY